MEIEPRIEADFELGFREFYHAIRWNSWRNNWWLYGLLAFSFLAVLLRNAFESDAGKFTGQLVANLPELFIPVFLGCLVYWTVYRSAQRQFKTSDSVRQTIHYLFSNDGLEYSSAVTSGQCAWSGLYRVRETPEAFLFFTSNAAYGIFPKRCLKDEEQIQALRNIIRQHMGSKAKLKG